MSDAARHRVGFPSSKQAGAVDETWSALKTAVRSAGYLISQLQMYGDDDYVKVAQGAYSDFTDYRNLVVRQSGRFPRPLLPVFEAIAVELDSILSTYYNGKRFDDYQLREDARRRYEDMESLETEIISWRREYLGQEP